MDFEEIIALKATNELLERRLGTLRRRLSYAESLAADAEKRGYRRGLHEATDGKW